MDKNSNDFLNDILNEIEFVLTTKDQIKKLLPDNHAITCSIMSAAMDEYFIEHGISAIDGWKVIFETVKEVHEQLGDK